MTATKPGEQIIPADALISSWLLSANRNEREFPHLDRFDRRCCVIGETG
jgi:cytochrome P450